MLLLTPVLCPAILFSFMLTGFFAHIPRMVGPALVGKACFYEIV